MKPMLIGSRALHYHKPEYIMKNDADYDFMVEKESDTDSIRVDGKIDPMLYDYQNNREIAERFGLSVRYGGRNLLVCDLPGLAVIKRSHLWRPEKFDKDIFIWHKYLKPNFDESYRELARIREKLTISHLKAMNPSLKKSNDEFFDDAVEKKVDHDWLHELVAFYDKPIYESLKYDMSKAWCEKELWDRLSHQDKIRCVSEEAHVIAIEREMIPKDWKPYVKPAFYNAMVRICTTLSSGWFREFAIDNFYEILETVRKETFKKVKEEVYVVLR